MTPIAITSVEIVTYDTVRPRAPRWPNLETFAGFRCPDRFTLDIWRHLGSEALQ